MRRYSLSIFLLFLMANAVAYAQNTPSKQKVIRDPAEYNAYIAALNLTDPAQKAAAMESFVNKYPNSVVKIDAMEQTMAAYQQTADAAKVEQTANRVLEFDSNNMRALAIVTYLKRARATQSGNAKEVAEAGAFGERGLAGLAGWQKAEGQSDADFEKQKNQMATIFNGAVGFSALQNHDYARASQYLVKSVRVDPENLQDLYQLGIADLEKNPIDLEGYWYLAKAINLARAHNSEAAAKGIETYAQARYKKYHGTADGWDKLVAGAARQSAPPEGFARLITPALTPAEIAIDAVKQNDPAKLSFSDWEFILSYRDASPANKQAAQRVWQAIQELGKNGTVKMKIPVKVISATSEKIQAAITDENIQANKADLEITMEKPMLTPPAPGSQIQIIGLLIDYRPLPFVFLMKGGSLPE